MTHDGAARWPRQRALALAATLTMLIAAVALLTALHPSVARADGDPASDVLLGTDVFFPFEPVKGAVAAQLKGDVAAAKQAGSPIKVALIPQAVDLGTVAALFGKAQPYADFLATEISFVGKAPLLIVMADGYGTNDMSAAAVKAVAALPKPAGPSATDLAQAAITAVQKISAANGHPISGAAATSSASAGSSASGGSGNGSTILIVALIAAALLGTAALVAATLHRRHEA